MTKLLTSKEAAEMLAISTRSLARIDRGNLPRICVLRSVRYDVRDLELFINKQRGLSHGQCVSGVERS